MLPLLSLFFRLVCFALPPWCCLTGAVCRPISGSISTAHPMCAQSAVALPAKPRFKPIWKSPACTLPGASATGSWLSISCPCFIILQAVSFWDFLQGNKKIAYLHLHMLKSTSFIPGAPVVKLYSEVWIPSSPTFRQLTVRCFISAPIAQWPSNLRRVPRGTSLPSILPSQLHRLSRLNTQLFTISHGCEIFWC